MREVGRGDSSTRLAQNLDQRQRPLPEVSAHSSALSEQRRGPNPQTPMTPALWLDAQTGAVTEGLPWTVHARVPPSGDRANGDEAPGRNDARWALRSTSHRQTSMISRAASR